MHPYFQLVPFLFNSNSIIDVIGLFFLFPLFTQIIFPTCNAGGGQIRLASVSLYYGEIFPILYILSVTLFIYPYLHSTTFVIGNYP